MEGLICPKCHGVMRNYERSGVTVDQCTECRGIFLDRGELEKLVDAENSHYSAAAPSQPREPEYRERKPEYREPEHRGEREYRGEHYGGQHGQHGKRKKRSFLEDLFD
jgi:Zn-finger nucleic acid-binding protein